MPVYWTGGANKLCGANSTILWKENKNRAVHPSALPFTKAYQALGLHG